jgi:hypothetical protein
MDARPIQLDYNLSLLSVSSQGEQGSTSPPANTKNERNPPSAWQLILQTQYCGGISLYVIRSGLVNQKPPMIASFDTRAGLLCIFHTDHFQGSVSRTFHRTAY